MLIGFDRFARVLASEFSFEPDSLSRETRLGSLHLDSFELFRLAIVLESLLPGIEVPDSVAIGDLTLGDVHDYLTVEASVSAFD